MPKKEKAETPLPPSDLFEIFEIVFDAGSEPVFHGGELITGFLRVNLKQLTKIKKITLQFKGRAVWLADGAAHGKKSAASKKGTPPQNEKVYFDKDFVILERPPGHPENGKFEWNANFTYSLPFECPLPRGCETSYESPTAFIRYFARATLITEHDPPVKYFTKKAFSVVAPPELHQLIPPQSEPIIKQESMRFGSCCCVGKLKAEVALPKSAYAPGENVIGTITVTNQNAWNIVDKIEVRFVDRAQRIPEGYISELIPADPKPTSPAPPAHAVNGPAIVDGGDANGQTIDGAPTDKKDKKQKKEKAKKKGTDEKQQIIHADGEEKKGKRKAIKQKPQPTQAELDRKAGIPSLPHRVIELRHLKKEDFIDRQSKAVTHTALFLTIPPVPPTTAVDTMSASVMHAKAPSPEPQLESSPKINSLMEESQQFSKILESPSTLTLKQRRQPFIRVDYAIQVSLGQKLLLEIPIAVHPIPIYERGIAFRDFGGGAQELIESDEADARPVGGPFIFTPQYPVYLDSPVIVVEHVPAEPIMVGAGTTVEHQQQVITPVVVAVPQQQPQGENPFDPSPAGVLRQVQRETETNQLPLGVETLTRTIETTTLPDGTEVINRREERCIVETITTEEQISPPPQPASISQEQQQQSTAPVAVSEQQQPVKELAPSSNELKEEKFTQPIHSVNEAVTVTSHTYTTNEEDLSRGIKIEEPIAVQNIPPEGEVKATIEEEPLISDGGNGNYQQPQSITPLDDEPQLMIVADGDVVVPPAIVIDREDLDAEYPVTQSGGIDEKEIPGESTTVDSGVPVEQQNGYHRHDEQKEVDLNQNYYQQHDGDVGQHQNGVDDQQWDQQSPLDDVGIGEEQQQQEDSASVKQQKAAAAVAAESPEATTQNGPTGGEGDQ